MRSSAGLVGALLAVLLCGASAPAAPPDYCQAYAQRAVWQYKVMRDHPQCVVGDGPRWNGTYENHFNGCRGGRIPHLQGELEARDVHLRSCGALRPDGTAVPVPPPPPDPPAVPAQPLDPKNVPLGFEECEGTACDHKDVGVWIFHGQNGEARWPTGAIAKLKIDRFDAGGVVIRRTDTTNSSSPGFTAVYQATFRDGKYTGTVHATWPGHFPKGNPPGEVRYTWFATIPQTQCDPALGSAEAIEIGQSAVKFRRMADGFQCFLIAAKQGDGAAKSYVGLMYRDGIGTEVNYPEAFKWLKASAIQGDYNAQVALSQMYELGVGTAPDPKTAALWKEQAQNNPVMVRQRQQAQQQQHAQDLMFLGFAAILEAATRPDYVIVY